MKVAVVAIAKDEGKYIHEWIHHYLYFGFDKLFVATNRCSDSTVEILNKINHEKVYSFDTTFLDKADFSGFNPTMQRASYSVLFNEISLNHLDITHVLIVDIDEFWFPVNFKDNISEYINNKPTFDIMSFQWLNQTFDDECL